MEIEAQRAGHIAEKGRRREGRRVFGVDEAFEPFQRPRVFAHFDGGRLRQVHIDAHFGSPHRNSAFVFELIDVAARFARRFFVGMRAVEHVHALRPLNQPIKIVGVDPFVVFGRRQRKGRPQVVGDERCLRHAVAREVVVVHREDDHVLEVEVAGFQDAHYLQSLQRFALERNAERLEVAAQQRGIGFCFDGYAAGFERVAQFVDFFGDDCQEFGPLASVVSGIGHPGHRADDFQQPVGEFLPVFGRAEDTLQQAVAAQPRGVDRNPAFVGYLLRQRAGQRFVAPRNIGMVQQSRRVRVIESRFRPFAPAAGLQRHQPFHKGVGQSLFERIAHRHIDLARFCGQRVEQRQQQIFVGQHHRRPFVQRRLPGIFAQDFRGVFALHGI